MFVNGRAVDTGLDKIVESCSHGEMEWRERARDQE